MNENSSEKDLFLSIDQDLKDMASDIPDMPDSYRSGWRRAIRADAKSNSGTPKLIHPESVIPPEIAPDKTPVRHSRRWTYLLSAAAALIFLVAGTLATRGMLSPRLKEKAPDTGSSILSAEEGKSSSSADRGMQHTSPAARDAAFEEDAAVFSSQYAAEEESAVSRDSMETAEEEYEEYPDEKSFSVSTYASVIKSDSVVQEESDRSSGKGTEVSAGSANERTETSLPAEAPESPIVSSLSAAQQQPASADISPNESLGTHILWFFEDMGAFILAALPYIAVAGILLLIIVLIKHKR